jgi:hypothetical protein
MQLLALCVAEHGKDHKRFVYLALPSLRLNVLQHIGLGALDYY